MESGVVVSADADGIEDPPTDLASLGHLPLRGEASGAEKPSAPPLGELAAQRTEGAFQSREALLISTLHSQRSNLFSNPL